MKIRKTAMGSIAWHPPMNLARFGHGAVRVIGKAWCGGAQMCVKINGNSAASVLSSQKPLDAVTANLLLSYKVVEEAKDISAANGEDARRNIPTEKLKMDQYRQGVMIGGVGYRQTVVVRSYEVGTDNTATLESILILLQVRKWYPKIFL